MKVATQMVSRNDNSKGTSKPKMAATNNKPNSGRVEKGQQKYFEKKNDANKPKVEQVKYIKTFDSFQAGMTGMINVSGDVYELLRDVDADYNNVDGAMKAVLQVFTDHMPSITDRKNMHYDLSLSANKCSLKTDKFVSFGWYVKSTKTDSSFDTSYIFHIIVFGNKNELVADLVSDGWIVDTYKK